MMESKKQDYSQMIECGKWLETIFKKGIKGWQYRDAFGHANKFLGIIKKNTPTRNTSSLKIIEYAADHNLESCLLAIIPLTNDLIADGEEMHIAYAKWKRDDRILNERWFKELLNKLNDIFLVVTSLNHSDLEKYPKFRPTFLRETAEFYIQKVNATHWFSNKINHDDSLKNNLEKMSDLDDVLWHYNKITDDLVFYKEHGLIHERNITYQSSTDLGKYYPTVIFSRVFLNFLIHGGIDYFGFCEFCGNFFVAERKGRKKFCSDICRTNNQLKQ